MSDPYDILGDILEHSPYWKSIDPRNIDKDFSDYCIENAKQIPAKQTAPTKIDKISYISPSTFKKGNRFYWKVGTRIAIMCRTLSHRYTMSDWLSGNSYSNQPHLIPYYVLVDITRSQIWNDPTESTLAPAEITNFSRSIFNISKDGAIITMFGFPLPLNPQNIEELNPHYVAEHLIPDNKYRMEMIYE